MNRLARLLPVLALLFRAGLVPAAAQEQVQFDPPLSQAFPLDAGPGGIHVRYPVLLNEHAVLPPGALLRFVYIDNNPGAHEHGGKSSFWGEDAQQGTITRDPNSEANVHGEGPASAWGADADWNDHSGLFDSAKKDDPKVRKKELQDEVWTQKDAFAEAFDHAAEVGTTIVYSLPAQPRPQSEALDLPEGMLLAEVDGHVRVLGVAIGSRAYQAGIRAGQEIRSFGGGPPLASLRDFARAFAAVKRQAQLSNGGSGYELDVWQPADGQVVPVRIAPPPSIPSFL